MRTRRLAPMLMFCCAFAVGVAGCQDLPSPGATSPTTGGATTQSTLPATTLSTLPTTTLAVTTTSAAVTTTTAIPAVTTTATVTVTTVAIAGPVGWTEVSPAGAVPPARMGHGMVYDPSSGKVFLFGGNTDAGDANDTWVYDPGTKKWKNLSPAGPLPSVRQEFGMALDTKRHLIFIFGGSSSGTNLNDTWVYDIGNNAWKLLTPGANVPAARWGTAMVYDPETKKVILFGGETGDMVFANDTWAYDPATNTWTNLHPAGSVPDVRAEHAIVYDSAKGRMLLFGGTNSGSLFNDTWAYNTATNKWKNLSPAGSLPEQRDYHAMAYDSDTRLTILFGGTAIHRMFLADTWAYDANSNRWKDISPAASPSFRVDHAMVYDPVTSRVILFGGYLGPPLLDDTWLYEGP